MMKTSFWSLNKALVLLLLGGFAMLLLDIRYEHRAVLGKETASWIPVIYAGAMIILAAVGLAVWERGGRALLMGAFAVSLIVGGLGVYFHTEGKPARLLEVLSPSAAPAKGQEAAAPVAATNVSDNEAEEGRIADAALKESGQPSGEPAEKKEGNPPPLAPLAFLGLGAMGLLATSRKFPGEAEKV